MPALSLLHENNHFPALLAFTVIIPFPIETHSQRKHAPEHRIVGIIIKTTTTVTILPAGGMSSSAPALLLCVPYLAITRERRITAC